MKKKIYFRADGNSQIGLGHVIRSLSLAEMLNDTFECHFIIKDPSEDIKNEILKICQTVIEIDSTFNLIVEANFIKNHILFENEILVLDGYHFETEYQTIFKETKAKLVCIDDICNTHFVADVILNHGAGFSPNEYSKEPYTKCYLGLAYALLRKPFRAAAKISIQRETEKNIFICFGGADPQNETLNVLKRISQSKIDYNLYIIIGAANKFKNEIESFLKDTQLNYQLLNNLSAEEMLLVMKKCAIAITPPSSISYEYLSVGGELYLKVIADNQKRMCQYFIDQKLALDFDSFPNKLSDVSLKQEVLKNQKEIFDGQQKDRFINIFKQL